MSWEDTIREAHTRVTDAVSHHARLRSDRYFVWQEAGDNALYAEGVIAERDSDPWAPAFEKSMAESGIAWYLNTIQYEPDTGFRHYEWVWEVLS